MRIAVHNPVYMLQDQKKNFCGYNYEFIIRYASVLFVTDVRRIRLYQDKLKELGRSDIELVTRVSVLNQKADVLVSFSGVPNRLLYRPPKGFKGIKIYHVMDYVFEAGKAAKALKKSQVDYLMGYCDHSKYCRFFQAYYPGYEGKILSVPFGYGKRFQNNVPFEKRRNKAIALGSVNPVNDGKGNELKEYRQFYATEEFTHKLRRAVVMHRQEWKDCIDDLLPTFPQTKNPDYDPVEKLNAYTMYINDAGLMNFPPARTYEGIACGCVMVAERLPIWEDLGFQEGINCILFQKGDYQDMADQISYYRAHEQELQSLQKESLKLAKRYRHEDVAKRLYADINARMQQAYPR